MWSKTAECIPRDRRSPRDGSVQLRLEAIDAPEFGPDLLDIVFVEK